MIIDSELIHDALTFYKERGYKLSKVPYLVDICYSEFTCPEDREQLYHNNKVYVGSAEQSFIELLDKGLLCEGNYVTITPCYRDESTLDDLHFNIFLKIELFSTDEHMLDTIINDAYDFYRSKNVETSKLTISIDQIDLISNSSGVELGSYGKRTFKNKTYSYGTGLAEPRFSNELNSEK